jgi:hypothetical protein
MIDMTSGFLATFILGELRPVISRHPRFRDNDGSAVTAFSNLITYKDVSLTVGSTRSNGDRQSADNFMCTVLGRAVFAKLNGMNGSFIEWLRETQVDDTLPQAGVYYLSIESVNEETREVTAVLQTYRWLEGRRGPGAGSHVYIRLGLSPAYVAPVDPLIDYVPESQGLRILTYTPTLALKRTDTNTVLVEGTDWWIEPYERHLVYSDTPGGQVNDIQIPPDYVSFDLFDQNGTKFRPGQDWTWVTETTVRLAPWTAKGLDVWAEGTWRRTSAGDAWVNPENFLQLSMANDEKVVPGQAIYTLVRGEFVDDIGLNTGGIGVFKHLLDVGDRARWEVRVEAPQVYVTFKKMAINPNFLPGLTVAVGDQVEVGDQAAIIVFPNRCEVYEVYGAKDNVSFDLTVKSNDLLTSTELAGLVKNFMLIEGRDRLESAGLSIQTVSTAYTGGARDASGTTSTHSVTLSVTALADWEYHKPLVNRVDDIDVDFTTYPGSPEASGLVVYGISRFTPSYQ